MGAPLAPTQTRRHNVAYHASLAHALAPVLPFGTQEKAVDCNEMMEVDESQTQDEGVTQQARQASLAMTPEEMATEDARLEQEEDEDKALDADVFAEELVEEVAKEMAEEMAEPQLGQGFRFRINLGRRFGPQDATPQQPQRIRFVRPSTASMANSPFNAIFNGGGADYDSPFDTGFGGFSPGSGTSLLSALFGGGMPQIPAARQQFLLGAPSFMTRRVFYPDTQSQSPVRAARFQPVTMRLATQDELHDLGLDAYGADAVAASLGLGYTENARRQDAVMDAVEQWKTAAGVQSTQDATQQSARAMRPLSPIRLTSAPGLAAGTGALPVVPAAPNAGSNAGADDAWYTGYRARRALYCVASIALVMAIIALNAALLMCCASACCRNFGQADSEEVFTVESVAATTPLLLEYEVERVPKPGYEHAMHAGGEEMIVVHQMAPMPREGKAAF